MKRIVSALIIVCLLFIPSYAPSYAFDEVSDRGDNMVSLQIGCPNALIGYGKTPIDASNPNVAPLIVNDRTMLPLRFVAEAFNAEVAWVGETKTAHISYNGTTTSVTVGESYIYVDGAPIPIDAPPVIIEERTMLPLRAIAENALGKTLYWDAQRKVAIIADDYRPYWEDDSFVDYLVSLMQPVDNPMQLKTTPDSLSMAGYRSPEGNISSADGGVYDQAYAQGGDGSVFHEEIPDYTEDDHTYTGDGYADHGGINGNTGGFNNDYTDDNFNEHHDYPNHGGFDEGDGITGNPANGGGRATYTPQPTVTRTVAPSPTPTRTAIPTPRPSVPPAGMGSNIAYPIVKPYGPYTYETLLGDINALSQYDCIVSTIIGKSVEGRDIPMLKLGYGGTNIYIEATAHGREYIATSFIMKFTEEAARAYAAGESLFGYDIANLLSEYTYYIIPMLNPDGASIAQSGLGGSKDPEHIKTIKISDKVNGYKGWKANANGVDFNANYPINWRGSVNGPSSNGNAGTSGGSEPEVQAVLSLIDNIPFEVFGSFHAQGEVLYWHDTGYNADTLKKAEALTDTIAKATGFVKMARVNTAGAGLCSYARGKLQKPALTVEVAPYIGDVPYPDKDFDRVWEKAKIIPLLLAGATKS